MFEGMMTPLTLPVEPGALQGRSSGAGVAFFVGGSGASDNNEGTDPQFPLSKIDTALGLCTNGRHDYIFVQDYWDNDSFPVVVDKQCVRIIGLGAGNPMGMWCLMNSGAAACFSIGTAGYGEIAGFSMIADTSNPGILVTLGNECKIHIHHCAFGEHGATRDGIDGTTASVEFNQSLVEHCIFGHQLTRDGLRLGIPTWSWIMHNLFRAYGGVGVHLYGAKGGELGGVIGNKFYKDAAFAKGDAITLSTCANGLIDENHAMEDGADPGIIPYLDTSSPINAWGVNWSGDKVAYPETSA